MMRALTVHRGLRIGRAPVNPYRFHTVRELNRAGVKVIRRNDLEWFQWQPRTNTIVVRSSDDPWFLRGTIALALAHRALGHWQNSLVQDIEARDLAARWLISDTDAAWALDAVPVLGYAVAAAQLRIHPAPLRVRVGGVCGCLSNLDLFHEWDRDCGTVAVA
jgi:hypothetical protein